MSIQEYIKIYENTIKELEYTNIEDDPKYYAPTDLQDTILEYLEADNYRIRKSMLKDLIEYTVKFDHTRVLEEILDRLDLQKSDYNRLVDLAVKYNRLDIIDLLLSYTDDEDVNVEDLILNASIEFNKIDIVNLLLEKSPEYHVESTYLSLAIERSAYDILQELVKHKNTDTPTPEQVRQIILNYNDPDLVYTIFELYKDIELSDQDIDDLLKSYLENKTQQPDERFNIPKLLMSIENFDVAHNNHIFVKELVSNKLTYNNEIFVLKEIIRWYKQHGYKADILYDILPQTLKKYMLLYYKINDFTELNIKLTTKDKNIIKSIIVLNPGYTREELTKKFGVDFVEFKSNITTALDLLPEQFNVYVKSVIGSYGV